MRLLFVFAVASGLAACVEVESVPLVFRLTGVPAPLELYHVELWRGGSCPSAGDAFAGVGTGGTLVEVKDGAPAALGGFANIEEGDFVVFALGRNLDCEPLHFGCSAFRAGDDEVVVEIGDSGWDPSNDECPGEVCEAGSCVPMSSSCIPLELATPESCTIPRDCGPSYAFTCADMTCMPKLDESSTIPVDVMRATEGEVVGERFALVGEGTEFIHVLAPVVHAPAAPSLEVWSAPRDQLMSPVVTNADAPWSLDGPFAVAARDDAGAIVAVAYDQGTPMALNIGEIDDGSLTLVTPIGDSTPRSGIPTFTGVGANLRQFWYGEASDGESRELSSISPSGDPNSQRFFISDELPPLGANEIIGSMGDYALLASATEDVYFLAFSEPGATGVRMPMAEPQRETLDGITDRPAFVHLGGDRYLLLFPADGMLVLREATCTGATCTFADPDPEPIPMGMAIRALRAEALFDSGNFDGVAVAYGIDDCMGSSHLELLLLDRNLRPSWKDEVEFEFAHDIELAVMDLGDAWRVFVAWLRNDEATNVSVGLKSYAF